MDGSIAQGGDGVKRAVRPCGQIQVQWRARRVCVLLDPRPFTTSRSIPPALVLVKLDCFMRIEAFLLIVKQKEFLTSG